MIESFRKFAKQIRFDLIKLPEDVQKFANKIIIFNILSCLIPDLFSFALKGAQISLTKGYTTIAIVLLLLHFSHRVLDSMFNTFYGLQADNYNQLSVSESTKKILDISNVTKSKVFKTEGKIVHMVEQPEVIKITRDYIEDFWAFYLKFPTTIAQIIILFVTLIASTILQILTSTLLETAIITGLLIFCFVFYFYLSNKRIKVMRNYRKIRKKNESETDVLYTEIKSTDFISKKDFAYHAEKLRAKLDDNIAVTKTERLKLNKIFINRALVASLMMILIMIIKFVVTGAFTVDTFVDIVALSTIYGTMLVRISNITSSYESIMDILIDVNTLYEDFNNINTVYEKEMQRNIVSTAIENLTVTEFTVTQDKNGAFELINNNVFILNSGDTIMAYGRTGCGKSTLINMFTGKMNLVDSPIHFSNGDTGYLNSIGYQTDRAMVNNFVLNELALTDKYEEIDYDKVIYLLKGVDLYDEIIRMIKNENLDFGSLDDNEKLIEFLKIRKTNEFSSGQKQRLALVKLLYSLDDTIQLVALDEPFNRLDDLTCKKCIEFIKNYVLQQNRILFIATHQVDICRPYCNVEISFGEDLTRSIIKVQK